MVRSSQQQHWFFLHMSSVKKWTCLKYSLQQPDLTGWDHTGLFDENLKLLRHLCLHYQRLQGQLRDVGVRLQPRAPLLYLQFQVKLIKDPEACVWVYVHMHTYRIYCIYCVNVCVPNHFSVCACDWEKCPWQMLLLHPHKPEDTVRGQQISVGIQRWERLRKVRRTLSGSRPEQTVSSLTGFSFLLVALWCVDVKEHLRSLSYVVQLAISRHAWLLTWSWQIWIKDLWGFEIQTVLVNIWTN